MNSSLFIEIERRRNDLELLFLNFPSTDSPIPQNQDKIKAFIILFHSEIEYYFELIGRGVSTFQNASHVAANDYSAIPNHYFVFGIKQPDFSVEIDKDIRGKKIIQDYEKHVANRNNGIKTKDVLAMLLPLGIEYSHIGLTLLNTLNDYGDKRCKYAHTGVRCHLAQVLDRDTESRLSKTIIAMIKNLDDYIMINNTGIAI